MNAYFEREKKASTKLQKTTISQETMGNEWDLCVMKTTEYSANLIMRSLIMDPTATILWWQ